MEKTEKRGQTNKHVNTEDFEVTTNKSDGKEGMKYRAGVEKDNEGHPLNQGTDLMVCSDLTPRGISRFTLDWLP